MIDLVKIAKIGSTQGKSGAMKLYPEEYFQETIRDLEFIFIKINGSKVPFKVKKINSANEPWLIHIDQVTGPEEAQLFTNMEVFAETEIVGENIVVSDDTMKGFKIFSNEGNAFGQVIEIEEHPQQILLVVEWKNKTFRLPFHPDLILDMDKEKKSINYTYTKENLEMLFS